MRPLAAVVLVLLLPGCEFVGGFIAPTPEEALVRKVRSAWLEPGAPLAEGVLGGDTIASVEPTGERSWQVQIPDPSSLEGRQSWEVDVRSVEVYRVYPDEAFIERVNEAATEAAGRRGALPLEAWRLVSSGELEAVGSLEVEARRTDRAGGTTLERVAYLVPEAGGGGGVWEIQPEARSAVIFRDALRAFYDRMTLRDDEVQTCMGSAMPREVERSVQLACVSEVLEERYGGEET